MIGPKSADALRDFLATPDPQEMPDKDRIESMISRLSLATAKQRPTKEEAKEALELYWLALKDIPLRDLGAAFNTLIKTATFMPKPAEVRAAASASLAKRNYLRSRARYLVWLHEREWVAPIAEADRITADEIAEINRKVSEAMNTEI